MHELLILLLIILIVSKVFQKLLKIKYIYATLIVSIIIWILLININPYKKREDKFSILEYISHTYTPKMYRFNKINKEYIHYPIIIKPTICASNSIGVKLLKNTYDLQEYLSNNIIFSKNALMLQEFIPYKNEVGILYEKNLVTNGGSIISIVKKNTPNKIIHSSCYNNSYCEDITYKNTNKLNTIFTTIANSIPNFNIGRFDVKYKNETDLFNGKNFYILEVNGALGFDLRKHTSDIITSNYYIFRWIIYRMCMGFMNIIKLQSYNPIQTINAMTRCII